MNLPYEITLVLVSYLDKQSLTAFSLACKTNYQAFNDFIVNLIIDFNSRFADDRYCDYNFVDMIYFLNNEHSSPLPLNLLLIVLYASIIGIISFCNLIIQFPQSALTAVKCSSV